MAWVLVSGVLGRLGSRLEAVGLVGLLVGRAVGSGRLVGWLGWVGLIGLGVMG